MVKCSGGRGSGGRGSGGRGSGGRVVVQWMITRRFISVAGIPTYGQWAFIYMES